MLDFIKIKIFCLVKDPAKAMKRQATHLKKISAKYITDKGLVSRLYKELSKLKTKKKFICIMGNRLKRDISLKTLVSVLLFPFL